MTIDRLRNYFRERARLAERAAAKCKTYEQQLKAEGRAKAYRHAAKMTWKVLENEGGDAWR